MGGVLLWIKTILCELTTYMYMYMCIFIVGACIFVLKGMDRSAALLCMKLTNMGCIGIVKHHVKVECGDPTTLYHPNIIVIIINSRRMHRKVTVVVYSFRLSVTMKSAAYMYLIYLWCFQGFCRMAFAENASFKSSGVICWQIAFLAFFVLPHPTSTVLVRVDTLAQ